MVERKSGPVKPPVLEMSANKPDAEGGTKAKPAGAGRGRPRPLFSMPKIPWPPLLAGGAAGAFIAGLIVIGLWRFDVIGGNGGISAQTVGRLSGQLEGIEAKSTSMETALAKADENIKAFAARLDDLEEAVRGLSASSPDQSQLGERIAALENQPATATAPDLSGIKAEIAQLQTALKSASGGTIQPDPAMAEKLDSMSAAIAELGGRLEREAATALEQQSAISDLSGRLASVASAQALPQQPLTVSLADLQVPVAIAGLSDALVNGRPFATELAVLGGRFPEIAVPGGLRSGAVSGLATPAALSLLFEQSAARIIAAEPLDPDAGWFDSLWRRIRVLLVLRGAGENNEGPQGLVGQIELGIKSGDFAAAKEAFDAMPEAMRAAGADLGTPLGTFAEGLDYLGAIRKAVLAPTSEAKP